MPSNWTEGEGKESKTDDGKYPNAREPSASEAQAKGRRPRRNRPGADGEKDAEVKPAPKAREGGWGLDGPSSTPSSDDSNKMQTKAQRVPPDEIEPGRRGRVRNHFDDDDTDILVIPDLEDEAEDDITTKVALAPKNTVRRIPTLEELHESLKNSIPMATSGLDLSLLTKTLVPVEMLEEDDNTWDFDTLLQGVTQEFNAEMGNYGTMEKNQISPADGTVGREEIATA